MFSDMKNRAAIITGGAGGIGKQTAIRMAELGAKICISDIQESLLNTTLQEFKELGIDAIGVQADVSKYEDTQRMAQACINAFGKVDILVNCVGVYKLTKIEDMTEDQWTDSIAINLNSVFFCCRSVLNNMIKNHYGKIVSLTSQSGLQGSILHAHYDAAKAGITGFTRSLAKEIAQHGINVNCVAPGIIETGMVKDLIDNRGEIFLNQIPLGRFGSVDDCAKVVVFLASDDASYMTGQTINVTGGWLMR